MSEHPIPIRLKCETAWEFVNALAPHHPPGGDPSPRWHHHAREGKWLYRGHACSTWQLIPSALRRGASTGKAPFSWVVPPAETILHPQVYYEFVALRAFATRADEAGLRIPEDSQAFRRAIEEWEAKIWLKDEWQMPDPEAVKRIPFDWPPTEFLSALALAQHHGIPTRLLDWSRSPFIAAYFAASEVLGWTQDGHETCQGCEGLLSVVTLKSRPFVMLTRQQRNTTSRPLADAWLDVVGAPTEGNANLRAQQGEFTLLRPLRSGVSPELSLSMALAHIVEKEDGPSEWRGLRDPLIEIGVPHAEASILLDILDSYGINAATVWPGYGGVVKALREGPQVW